MATPKQVEVYEMSNSTLAHILMYNEQSLSLASLNQELDRVRSILIEGKLPGGRPADIGFWTERESMVAGALFGRGYENDYA